jgi:probable addiction module antidote protein
MPKRTRDYHSWLIERLADPREAERYLRVAIEDSPEIFFKALRNVAEANKMAKVAEQAGVNRESLYKALSKDGNPLYITLDSVLAALGMELTVRLKQGVSNSSPSKKDPGFDIISTDGTGFVFIGQSKTKSVSNYVASETKRRAIPAFFQMPDTNPSNLDLVGV